MAPWRRGARGCLSAGVGQPEPEWAVKRTPVSRKPVSEASVVADGEVVGAPAEDCGDPFDVLVAGGQVQAREPGEEGAQGDLEFGAGEGGTGAEVDAVA